MNSSMCIWVIRLIAVFTVLHVAVVSAESENRVEPVLNPASAAILPEYPIASRMAGEEGNTELNVEILANGNIGNIKISKSSGHTALDNAAVTHIKKNWKFIPGKIAGTPVASIFPVLVEWKLKSRLPAYTVLYCGQDCGFKDAEAINSPLPKFPSKALNNDRGYVEGSILLDLTVTADGKIKDILADELVGPKDFADNAIRTVKTWTFKPATKNGVAVESNYRVRVLYVVDTHGEPGARRAVVKLYEQAKEHAKEKQVGEAITLLENALKKDELNFYERTVMSYALANYYLMNSDSFNALRHIRKATVKEGGFLPEATRASAIRLLIELNTRLNELTEVLQWQDILKNQGKLKEDDPLIKQAVQIKTILSNPKPIGISGKLIMADNGSNWTHTLIRRSFAFDNIKGKLDHFVLRCDQQIIKSPITDTAKWTVPPDYSGCKLFVYGAPDTTFRLIESMS